MVPKKESDVAKIVPSRQAVYFFREKSFIEKNPEVRPHYHIALPVSDNNYVILACIQTKYWVIEKHHKLAGIEDAIVYIRKEELANGELGFLTESISAIDCAQVKMMTYNKLKSEVVDGFKIYKTNIPQAMYSEIIAKTNKIKTIKKRIKKVLDDAI